MFLQVQGHVCSMMHSPVVKKLIEFFVTFLLMLCLYLGDQVGY